jgi:hypothetical protein
MMHCAHILAYWHWRLAIADAKDYPFMSISSRINYYTPRV